MEQYIQHLPTFFLMVFLGILSNLLIQYRKDKSKVNFGRILEEIFSSIWIAGVVAGCLDYFTTWSVLLVSGISSMAGFFHSKLIDSIGNDIIVAGVKRVVGMIKGENRDEYQSISEE